VRARHTLRLTTQRTQRLAALTHPRRTSPLHVWCTRQEIFPNLREDLLDDLLASHDFDLERAAAAAMQLLGDGDAAHRPHAPPLQSPPQQQSANEQSAGELLAGQGMGSPPVTSLSSHGSAETATAVDRISAWPSFNFFERRTEVLPVMTTSTMAPIEEPQIGLIDRFMMHGKTAAYAEDDERSSDTADTTLL
jgi:hypothetical protein